MTLNSYLLSFGRGYSRERDTFVRQCNTSLQYLRHVACGIKNPSIELCIDIEKASNGLVRANALRRDVDWRYLKAR